MVDKAGAQKGKDEGFQLQTDGGSKEVSSRPRAAFPTQLFHAQRVLIFDVRFAWSCTAARLGRQTAADQLGRHRVLLARLQPSAAILRLLVVPAYNIT